MISSWLKGQGVAPLVADNGGNDAAFPCVFQAIPGYVLLLMPVVYGVTGQPPFNTEITSYFSCECQPLASL